MKRLSESEFLRWANGVGLFLDERYPQSAVLSFRPDRQLDRFWEVPPEPECRPYFVASLLDLMGAWDSCSVWRHLGSWPDAADPSRAKEVVELQILKGLELPLGTGDVVEIARDEFDKLLTLIFATTIFGWSVGEDLYVVPNHARYLLQTDHHEVIHVSFRTDGDLEEFVSGMDARGFPLPDAVPDATFKQPSWMKTGSASGD
jgi:hypothetical protein